MSEKPLIICTSLNSEKGPHFEILKAAGFDVQIVDREKNLFQANQLIEAVSGASAIVAGSEPYTPEVIAGLPKLRVIARTGVGYDAVNLEACNAAKILVATTPGVNHHSVAEHTIGMLMAVSRGFPDYDQDVRQGVWKRVGYPRVMGRTLGLVGLGRIGRAVTTRAVGLGMKVVAFEPYPDAEFIAEWNVELVSLQELLAQSDYVSLHCPMSPENYHLINSDTLALMKPNAVLLNTARGPLIDETALAAALNSEQLHGAGLDVFEVEPLPLDNPLLKCKNVLLSGHVAGLDRESHEDTFRMSSHTIISLNQGEWPQGCIVNQSAPDGWTWNR